MSAPTTAEVERVLAEERRSARERKDPVSGGACWGLASYALPLAEERDAERARADAAEAEVGRMRKLFDDAGQGTYDVLALVEHWQAEAMRMASENDRFREALDIVCQWWGGCGHHPDDCPEDDAGDLVEDECKASKRVTDLTKGFV